MLLAVPCSAADAVALYDAADGTPAGEVAVGSHPVHLAAADGRVLVATMGERSVDVVADGAVERIETGVLGPSHFAVGADTAFVPCTGGDAVAVLDLETLDCTERVAVGAEPHDAELVDGTLYVGSRADGTVTVVDAETATVRTAVDLGTVDGTQARVQGLAAADDGVYAVDQANGRVAHIEAGSTAGVAGVAAVGENPYEPVVDDGRVLVAGRDDGTVTELSRDLSTATTHDVGGTPTEVVTADEDAWVFDRDRAVVRSLGGDGVELPHPGFAAARDPDRPARVYVSHYDDDAISAVDLDTGTVRWTADTPERPFEPLPV
ncbi:YncE family protein [Haloparvum sp. PAK95]|uniref:YncE family protein n=1 Tax=Haloparvum sp. PAK95 TaxID=3418962 RepID=UPI003D2EB888